MYRAVISSISQSPRRGLARLIGVYQKIGSFFFPGRCRFYPSCSEYSKQAVLRFGVLLGLVYAFNRLLKCHPFHTGGTDELPDGPPFQLRVKPDDRRN